MTLGNFFAAVDLDLTLSKPGRSMGKLPSLLLSDVMLIVGVGLGILGVLAFVVYLWVKWNKNRKRHVSGGEKVYRRSSSSSSENREAESKEEGEDSDEQRQGRRRYKYRVRRRGHRSRNPTLSEAGGLPPVRSGEPSKPI